MDLLTDHMRAFWAFPIRDRALYLVALGYQRKDTARMLKITPCRLRRLIGAQRDALEDMNHREG